jgi:hypothetical protein
VSSAQGEDRSDFQAVLPPVDRDGKKLDFIFFKATEGTSWVSQTYAENVALAKQHGVPFGSYHFLHPSLDVQAQIALFMSTVAAHGGLESGAILAVDSEITMGVNGEVMVLSDRSDILLRPDPASNRARIRPGVEYPHNWPFASVPAKFDVALVNSATQQFISGVRTAVEVALGGDHCQELVYTFEAMLPQLSSCTEFPLWIAYFSSSAPPSVHPWADWTIWQYAGGGGNGGSDQDGFNGDVTAFSTWRLAKMPAPAPPPPPLTTSTFSITMPNLKLGSIDVAGSPTFVHRLQWLLAGLSTVADLPSASGLKADGSYGPATQTAVKDMQVFAKLSPDLTSASGEVGSAEWKFLVSAVYGTA